MRIEKIIEKIFFTLELGTIKSITYTTSSQNLVHLVATKENKEYYILLHEQSHLIYQSGMIDQT